MSSIVEIIEFKQPDYIDNTLYVCGMKGRYDEIQLAAKLNDTFSRFGLLYNVQVHVGKLIAINEEEDDNETPIKSYYAFVKYYSHNAAVQARRIMNGRTLMDQALFIKKCDPKRSVDPNQYYLGLNRCQELANYYLGFNSWSSSITSAKVSAGEYEYPDNKLGSISSHELFCSDSSLQNNGLEMAQLEGKQYRGKKEQYQTRYP
uniref:RAD52 motif-containing protein 1-like n=1 Tax=Saccoglossus kowalevskii TaxID=10224 RepID=A0ABM0M335_SACKO|nr:PREDICTED: RAD52 motif-containing protein 1-like [Saccoglossus kowalevskii]